MTLGEIQWMAVLFETGKMSKAADLLFVSQPALSQCLQRVEKELDFKLFERSNRGMVPTDKGRLFYETAKAITGTYDEFLAKAKLMDLAELQEFTIGMPPYLSSRASTDLLMQLNAAFPNHKFSVFEAKAYELEKAIRTNRIQVMVTSEPFMPDGLVMRPLTRVSTAVFLRSGSPAADHIYIENNKKFLDPVFLKEELFTVTKVGQASRVLTENLFRECGISPKILHETSHISTLYNNAKAGFSSSIGMCSPPIMELEKDNDHAIICYIPDKYRWSRVRVGLYSLPEIDRLIPDSMFHILQDTVIRSGSYFCEG